jgi:hypothetical protein
MSVQDWQFQINGLTIGAGTPYLIMGVTGLGQPDVRSSDLDKSTEDGSYYGVDTYQARTIGITLSIKGTSAVDALAKVKALSAAWQLNGATVQPLVVQLPGGVPLTSNGRPRRYDDGDLAKLKTGLVEVTLEYYAADPILYSGANSAQATFAAVLPGRTYPATFPRSYGGGSSGTVTVANSGDYAVKPLVSIYGPATNPFVSNDTTGKRVTLSIVLASTDRLDIDMAAKTVMLNGTASRRSSVVGIPQWWSITPGSNTLRYGADSGTGSYAVVNASSGQLTAF